MFIGTTLAWRHLWRVLFCISLSFKCNLKGDKLEETKGEYFPKVRAERRLQKNQAIIGMIHFLILTMKRLSLTNTTINGDEAAERVCVLPRVEGWTSTPRYANAVMTGWRSLLHYCQPTSQGQQRPQGRRGEGGQNHEHKLICCLI